MHLIADARKTCVSAVETSRLQLRHHRRTRERANLDLLASFPERRSPLSVSACSRETLGTDRELMRGWTLRGREL